MNDNDSIFATKLLGFADEDKFSFFKENHHLIKDDSNYWNLLGTMWKLCGSVLFWNEWKPLFESKRRNPQKIMKTRERRAWRKLPPKLKVYRACNTPEEASHAICWTLSRKVAEQHSLNGARRIFERDFRKSDVFAFFDRRGEEEIIAFQPNTK